MSHFNFIALLFMSHFDFIALFLKLFHDLFMLLFFLFHDFFILSFFGFFYFVFWIFGILFFAFRLLHLSAIDFFCEIWKNLRRLNSHFWLVLRFFYYLKFELRFFVCENNLRQSNYFQSHQKYFCIHLHIFVIFLKKKFNHCQFECAKFL